MSPAGHQRVLIVDFGSQVTQLIARRLRESGVYCEIHPFDRVEPLLAQFDPAAEFFLAFRFIRFILSSCLSHGRTENFITFSI